MQRATFLLLAFLSAIMFLPTAFRSAARGCAAVYFRSDGTPVQIAEESAIILWDAAQRQQHFIRRAAFQTKMPYFGFLVPTPTRPELAPAPDSLFSRLEKWTRAKVEDRTEYHLDWMPGFGGLLLSASDDAPTTASVDVLDTQRLGSLDATVLRADDTQALGDWLAKHGYDARPVVLEWLKPYVERKWIITAFQIAKDAVERNGITTEAVRMSFATEQPFFPYSEPADQREGNDHAPRLLRVFFVGPQRVAGALPENSGVWPGKPVWADRLSDARREYLLEQLKLAPDTLPDQPWLTALEDWASPRPGVADLFFSPETNQTVQHRPPIYHIRHQTIPVGDYLIIAALLLLAAWATYRFFRKA
jgi:hypothetical protein